MGAPHGPCGRQACAHRHNVLKGGRRLGPSGLLVAQELEGFGLGAGGASGLGGRHLSLASAFSRVSGFPSRTFVRNETVYNDDERLAVLSPLHLNVTACDVSEKTA